VFSVPTSLLVLNCAWLASAILYLAGEKFGILKGMPPAIAYSFIVFASPLVAAAGALEALVVVYHVITIKTSWPTPALVVNSTAFPLLKPPGSHIEYLGRHAIALSLPRARGAAK